MSKDRYILFPSTLNGNMDKIASAHSSIKGSYAAFTTQVDTLRKNWKSKKGWKSVSKLEKDVNRILDSLETDIVNDYNVIKNAAERTAKEQEQWYKGKEITKFKYSCDEKVYSDEKIDVKVDDAITNLGNVQKGLQSIVDYIDDMANACHGGQTEPFGFGLADGGCSIASKLKHVLESARGSLANSFNTFYKTALADIHADEASMKAQEQAAKEINITGIE